MNHFNQSAYGSAEWAGQYDIRRAGMFKKQAGSVFLGFHNGRKIYGQGQGGILTIAAPRSGKLTTQIIANVCGKSAYQYSIVTLDPKGEIASVSQNQMFAGKACYYFNPMGLHGLPMSRINLLDHIVRGSLSIVVDAQSFMEEWKPLTGSANGKFFELSAREISISIIVTFAEKHGSVDLPTVHRLINQIERGTPEWVDLEYDMAFSKHDFVRRVASDILIFRESSKDTKGSMPSIMKELYSAFSCLNDPILRESVSPRKSGSQPFDFSFADMCTDGARPSNFYIMPPAELISVWSPVIKGLFQNMMTHKTRAPQSHPVLAIIDEFPQLGRFPLAAKLFVIGAGINIRPWIFGQALSQLDDLVKNGMQIITASAAIQCYYAVQDLGTADYISRSLGQEEFQIPDKIQQRNSRLAAHQIGMQILAGNANASQMLEMSNHRKAAVHLNKVSKPLMRPEEIMAQLSGKAIILCSDMDKPIMATRKNYYDLPEMNGYYHPNPYHPPVDSVKLAGGFFRRKRRVIREKVPQRFAKFPQYSDGYWSYIKGFRP